MSFLLGTRRNLTNLGAIPILVKLLSDRSPDLQILSAETLANVAKIRKGRKFIRKAGGIGLMVNITCTYMLSMLNNHTPYDNRWITWMCRIKFWKPKVKRYRSFNRNCLIWCVTVQKRCGTCLNQIKTKMWCDDPESYR